MIHHFLILCLFLCALVKSSIAGTTGNENKDSVGRQVTLEDVVEPCNDLEKEKERVNCVTVLIDKLKDMRAALKAGQRQETKGILAPVVKAIDDALTPCCDVSSISNAGSISGTTKLKVFRSAEKDGRPASFSWSRKRGGEETYQTNSAVHLTFLPSHFNLLDKAAVYSSFTATLEASLSSAKKSRNSNSLKWTAGLQNIIHGKNGKEWSVEDLELMCQHCVDPDEFGTPGQNFLFDVNAVYELNPSTDLATAGGEILGSLNYFDLGVGRYLNYKAFDRNLLSFRWRPYIGAEGGGRVNNGEAENKKEDSHYARLVGRVRADLKLGLLSERFSVSGDYKYWYRMTTSSHSRELSTISLNYRVSKNISLGLSYVNGRKPPSFGREKSLNLELGVLFGETYVQ